MMEHMIVAKGTSSMLHKIHVYARLSLYYILNGKEKIITPEKKVMVKRNLSNNR